MDQCLNVGVYLWIASDKSSIDKSECPEGHSALDSNFCVVPCQIAVWHIFNLVLLLSGKTQNNIKTCPEAQ